MLTDWMRQMVGLSDVWSGVIQDTASTSTLLALLCARERTSNYSLARAGLQGQAQPGLEQERVERTLEATLVVEQPEQLGPGCARSAGHGVVHRALVVVERAGEQLGQAGHQLAPAPRAEISAPRPRNWWPGARNAESESSPRTARDS